MSFLGNLSNAIIYQPLYNALIGLYDIIPDLGISIIILTVLIRVALLPVARKSIQSQKKMQELQPEIKKIQKKYKDDKQKQGKLIMDLYKKNGTNPASGCLPMIVQIVVLIALYRVLMAGISFDGQNNLLYSFIKNPKEINPLAFGFFDLSKPNLILALAAAVFQFWQSKMMMAKKNKGEKVEKKKEEQETDFSTIMQQQMLYMGPLLTLLIGTRLPSGLLLYWVISTLFMIGQQYFILEDKSKKEAESLTN